MAPGWETFAGIVGFVTVALVGLARLSAREVTELHEPTVPGPVRPGAIEPRAEGPIESGAGATDPRSGSAADSTTAPSMSPLLLLVNVALSQGLLGALLVGGAFVTGIPAAAFGLGPEALGAWAVGLGVGLGVALYVGDELLAVAATRLGVGYDEALRGLLAPDTARGWLLLFGVVLPVIAGFEELLFRGALVGALAAGFGFSPWLLAVGSSLVFGLAHDAQGPGGVAVTGLLGFGLAAAFVLTDSLVVVVVAHYLVNALEMVVHEGRVGRR